MAISHAIASGMGGMRTAGDLVARMQMTRGMKIDEAKKYVADKLNVSVSDLTDPVAGAFAGSGDVSVTARQGIQMDGRKPEGQIGAGVSDGFTGIFSQFPGGFRSLPSFFEDAVGPAVGDAGNVCDGVISGNVRLHTLVTITTTIRS